MIFPTIAFVDDMAVGIDHSYVVAVGFSSAVGQIGVLRDADLYIPFGRLLSQLVCC